MFVIKYSELAFQCFTVLLMNAQCVKPLTKRFEENSADAWTSSGLDDEGHLLCVCEGPGSTSVPISLGPELFAVAGCRETVMLIKHHPR